MSTEELKAEDKPLTEEDSKLAEGDAICQDIIRYGKEILTSDIFRKTATQPHHMQSTVMEHTMNVCIIAVKLCRERMRKGAQLNEKDLVQAALCHDLGMVGREEKYKHVIDTWLNHPKESAKIAKKIVSDLSPNAEQMIRCHMWPLSNLSPQSEEGKLLCLADKYASMADWQYMIVKGRYEDRIKSKIDELFTQEGLGDPSDPPAESEGKPQTGSLRPDTKH